MPNVQRMTLKTSLPPGEEGQKVNLTETSLNVFLAYARDADNWGGTPLVGGNVGGSKQERGNLTQLKRAGLIETFRDGTEMWISFTDAGKALAKEHGILV